MREEQKRLVDELLEIIWIVEEEKHLKEMTIDSLTVEAKKLKEQLCIAHENEVLDVIDVAVSEGFVIKANNKFCLSPEGRQRAAKIIRQHRLAEKLFSDVMEIPHGVFEEAACKFEHVLSEDVIDSVCTFLGHPPLCPHGKPIPSGKCCQQLVKTVEPVVMPLNLLDVGANAKITFIATNYPKRLQKLSTFGILPGVRFTLRQKNPAFILQIEQTTIALDDDIVKEIYVRKLV
jgi:DtxR family Mn-dependent transcriptional regulator